MKWALTTFISCLLFSQMAHAKAATKKPWIFFDLGKTLIDHTIYNPQTESFEKEWYMPGSYAYLTELKAQGYHIGLIANIPETWGLDYDEKLAKLKSSVALGWNDDPNIPAQPAFDWEMFDNIILPTSDAERKGIGNLSIYMRALAIASPCLMVYQGESGQEMIEAAQAGAITWQTGIADATEFFLAADKILPYVQARHSGVVCH